MNSDSLPGSVTSGVRDHGLQAERTALAWNRTGSAVLVNGLLAWRSGWASGHAAVTLTAMVLLVAAGAAFLFGAWRRRRLLATGSGIPAIAVAVSAACCLAASFAAMADIAVNHSHHG